MDKINLQPYSTPAPSFHVGAETAARAMDLANANDGPRRVISFQDRSSASFASFSMSCSRCVSPPAVSQAALRSTRARLGRLSVPPSSRWGRAEPLCVCTKLGVMERCLCLIMSLHTRICIYLYIYIHLHIYINMSLLVCLCVQQWRCTSFEKAFQRGPPF